MSHLVLAAWGAFLRPSFEEILVEAGIEIVSIEPGESPITAVPHCDALYVRMPNQAPGDVITNLPNLKVIAVPGAGLEVVDLQAATAQRIPVLSGGDMGAHAVAEWVLGAMVWLARDAVGMHEAVRVGAWEKRYDVESRRDLRSLTIGIIGYGSIGERVATAAATALGSHIIVSDIREQRRNDALSRGFDVMDIDDLIRASDIVTIHAQAKPGASPLVDGRRLNLFRPNAYLINTARGQLLDYAALVEALGSGALGGAALDVFPEEPPAQALVEGLADHPGVLLSPHQAGMTLDALESLAQGVATSIVDVLEGRHPSNCVNPQVWG